MPSRLIQRFKGWQARMTAPETDWIQVEVSSFCTAACVYCPRTVCRDTWINRHLPLATFERLLPVIANTGLVHLQGWGEPLLHPDFFTMVARAKTVHATVGTTTNGMLLEPGVIGRIFESGLDFISFSLAGVGPGNDRVRAGTNFSTIIAGMRNLAQERRKRGRDTPAIHVSYLLLHSNWCELTKLPEVIRELDVRQIVISGLDFVPDPSLETERIDAAMAADHAELRGALQHVKRTARSRGIILHLNLSGSGTPDRVCPENPQHALFVSSDGTVSPCVFANLPLSPVMSCNESSGTKPVERLVFGDINTTSLPAIWRRPGYAAFRQSFNTGQLEPLCQVCRRR